MLRVRTEEGKQPVSSRGIPSSIPVYRPTARQGALSRRRNNAPRETALLFTHCQVNLKHLLSRVTSQPGTSSFSLCGLGTESSDRCPSGDNTLSSSGRGDPRILYATPSVKQHQWGDLPLLATSWTKDPLIPFQ